MKKYFAYALVSFVMCAMLCGCGNNRVVEDGMMDSPITGTEMEVEDGIVKDKDGIIDDGKDGTGNGKTDRPGTGSTTTTSPSPEVSTKP